MRFKKFLIEKTMPFNTALEIFGIQSDELEKVKATYRKLVMMHHPDKGGDQEIFKNINNAHEVLKQAAKSPLKFNTGAREKQDEMWKKMGERTKGVILSSFDPDVFIKYFGTFDGRQFYHKMKRFWPDDKQKYPSYGSMSVGFESEFFTKNRDTVFTLYISVNLVDVSNASSGLGYDSSGENLSFDLGILAHGFHNNKKQKLSQRDYKWTNNHKVFTDPSIVYPKAKLKKIFSGATSKRAFKRRDMHAFLTQKLQAKTAGADFYDIPLGTADDGKEYKLTIYRNVFMRQAGWGPNGIYKGHKKIAQPKYVTMPESEDTAKYIQEIQKMAKKLRNPTDKNIINIVNAALKSYSDNRDAILKGVTG